MGLLNKIDMKTKRTIAGFTALIAGGSLLPIAGPIINPIMEYSIGPINLGLVVGGLAAIGGALLLMKEI